MIIKTEKEDLLNAHCNDPAPAKRAGGKEKGREKKKKMGRGKKCEDPPCPQAETVVKGKDERLSFARRSYSMNQEFRR